jgi:hypothetical protein
VGKIILIVAFVVEAVFAAHRITTKSERIRRLLNRVAGHPGFDIVSRFC